MPVIQKNGDILSGIVTVTNNGTNAAVNAQAVITITEGLEVVGTPVASKGSFSTVTGIWTIGGMNVSDVETLTILVQVTDVDKGPFTQVAVVSSDELDSIPGNNTATVEYKNCADVIACINDAGSLVPDFSLVEQDTGQTDENGNPIYVRNWFYDYTTNAAFTINTDVGTDIGSVFLELDGIKVGFGKPLKVFIEYDEPFDLDTDFSNPKRTSAILTTPLLWNTTNWWVSAFTDVNGISGLFKFPKKDIRVQAFYTKLPNLTGQDEFYSHQHVAVVNTVT